MKTDLWILAFGAGAVVDANFMGLAGKVLAGAVITLMQAEVKEVSREGTKGARES